MNTIFTNQIVQLESLSLVERALIDRRDEILTAIAEKQVELSLELMKELCELNIAIGDVEPAPLQEEAEPLVRQNAQLRQSINRVTDVIESIQQLEEKFDQLFGKAGQP